MAAALITLMAVFIAAVWRMLLQRVGGRRQVPTNCKIATTALGMKLTELLGNAA